MTFDERLALIVDKEYDVRCNNRIKRLIHKAQFPNTHAFLEDIEYLPDRHLNKDLLQRLATNEYINKKRSYSSVLQGVARLSLRMLSA